MPSIMDEFVKKGEEKNQIKMVINLHKMDCSNEMIAKAAEITEQEVKRILKEHNM
jgi:predicted transcriptional regulator